MLLASCHSHSFVNNIGGELRAPYRAKLKKSLPDNYMELPSDMCTAFKRFRKPNNFREPL